MTAYEVGYTGVIRSRATVSAAVYWNVTKDGIYFTPDGFYSGTNPPATWPSAILPPLVVFPLLASRGVLLPAHFTYLNLGTIKDKGFELGVDAAVNQYVNVFTNYSFQAMPVAEDLPAGTTIQRHQLAGEEPVQRRLRLQPRPLPRQPARQLHRRGVLAGRARPALCGHDGRLHAD